MTTVVGLTKIGNYTRLVADISDPSAIEELHVDDQGIFYYVVGNGGKAIPSEKRSLTPVEWIEVNTKWKGKDLLKFVKDDMFRFSSGEIMNYVLEEVAGNEDTEDKENTEKTKDTESTESTENKENKEEPVPQVFISSTCVVSYEDIVAIVSNDKNRILTTSGEFAVSSDTFDKLRKGYTNFLNLKKTGTSGTHIDIFSVFPKKGEGKSETVPDGKTDEREFFSKMMEEIKATISALPKSGDKGTKIEKTTVTIETKNGDLPPVVRKSEYHKNPEYGNQCEVKFEDADRQDQAFVVDPVSKCVYAYRWGSKMFPLSPDDVLEANHLGLKIAPANQLLKAQIPLVKTTSEDLNKIENLIKG